MAVFTEADKVKILSDLVKIKSVNDDEVEVAQYLQRLFADHGIKADLMPVSATRSNLVAEIGTDGPVLGISGHMDVVAPGDLNAWDSDPFTLTERDGKLYGRGATDMKSGLAAMVIAMIELHAAKTLTHGRVRLMATIAEEVGETGSQKFYEAHTMDDVDALLIGEPSGYNIAFAHKGSIDIKITSTGKTAHSSMPEQGYNALDPLIEVLYQANHAFRDTDRTNALMGPLVFNATIVNGGDQVNSIPGNAETDMNIRSIPEFDNDEAIATLQKLVDDQNAKGAQLKMSVFMSQPSVESPKDTKLSDLAAKIGEPYAGQVIPKLAIPAVTDASNLLKDKPHDFPFIMFGPGNETPHQVNENVDKQMYLDFIDLYQKLFVEYLK
ncbi:ArgE/DapE family deacylase [Lactiplantibacillus fabifermentans]|uniref:Probable succinyl-diaminopimelate desuccinylase n=2 Tax=Lactiplantibacillus fabifermentans TaxID=483011 RepID=A0A0R2NVK6_9LACO|nr:ArgE/DapE family deacylase [Lactiplantibacillus fabifermentans]ETY73220.1 succinyl-diaminopimelate desuccinylase [Lactiplantibacillus fabifermentans T30PCM01]KRO28352.1 succinyl-diaminopimelate desuccinylase [Lactiplantibacillus fabifermentans DSM 21115]